MARTLRGICSSPLSSDGEVGDSSSRVFPEMSPSPVATCGDACTSEGKRKPKAKRTILLSKKQKLHTRPSVNELIQRAPQTCVEYLADQLSVVEQTKHEAEFGSGHGYIVKVPESSGKSQRSDVKDWMRALGFTSSATLQHDMLRISNLKADVILSELKQRVHVPAEATHPTLLRMTQYYKTLDSQKMECASPSTNHRLLSSAQHMVIADAMEDVLAQPSLRRDRRVARRLSKLRRMSGRLLSSLATAPSSSSFFAPFNEDVVWDHKVEQVSLTPDKRRVSRGNVSSKPTKNVLEQSVLQIVLYSGLVNIKESKETLRKVSTVWEKLVIMAYAWTITVYNKKDDVYTTQQLYSHHPRGQYLADGAYKEVYKVFSSKQARLEAVSVMDVSDIAKQRVIRQEVAHSVMLSDATEHGICPNFLRVFDVFLAHERPSPDRWGSKEHRKPMEVLSSKDGEFKAENEQQAASDDRQLLFQYMRMEFCDGGDLEDFISLQENKMLPLDSVAVPYFFQMVFGLYCAREKFGLRHCDVKLLNFFLKDIGRLDQSKAPGAAIVLHYLLESTCFVLQMPPSFSYWVKLADYGAADSNLDHLGTSVTIDQFTTLENSPIEFLLEGDLAVQSYAADTFSLGLCLLHLFTGSAPYEEILVSVHCPPELLKDLKALWMSSRKSSGYSVIKSVARSDDENTLCHTLYRYVILFGLPEKMPSQRGKVWQLLLKHLRPEDVALNRPQRRRRRPNGADDAKTPKDQFDYDTSLYSIAHGSNTIISRCRDGLTRVPGALDLLTKLVDFDPLKRPTLKQVMYHPIFLSLRSPSQAPADYVVSYYGNRGQDACTLLDV